MRELQSNQLPKAASDALCRLFLARVELLQLREVRRAAAALKGASSVFEQRKVFEDLLSACSEGLTRIQRELEEEKRQYTLAALDARAETDPAGA